MILINIICVLSRILGAILILLAICKANEIKLPKRFQRMYIIPKESSIFGIAIYLDAAIIQRYAIVTLGMSFFIASLLTIINTIVLIKIVLPILIPTMAQDTSGNTNNNIKSGNDFLNIK